MGYVTHTRVFHHDLTLFKISHSITEINDFLSFLSVHPVNADQLAAPFICIGEELGAQRNVVTLL